MSVWDQFAPVAPPAKGFEQFPVADQPAIGVGEDVAWTAPAALTRGTIELLTTPRTVFDLGYGAGKWVSRKIGLGNADAPEQGPIYGSIAPALGPSSQQVKEAVETVAGPLHDPKTRVGKYVNTPLEMVPSALAGPAGSLRAIAGNVARFGILPGLTTEAAGHATEGTSYEPWARAAGTVAGLGTGAALSRPSGARGVLSEATSGIDDAAFTQAQRLVEEAAQRGINLTLGQALDQVTQGGAKTLLNVERVVEGSQRGRGAMQDFYADQPAAVRGSIVQEADRIAPPSPSPSMIGPRASEAARETIEGVEGAINRNTRPLYQTAELDRIPAQEYRTLANDPRYGQALEYIRNHPELGPQFAHLPDNSVGVVDAVKKLLRTRAEVTPQADATERFLGSLRGTAAENATNAATRASPDYALATTEQARLRGQYLEPLQSGPLGGVARAQSTEGAVGAVFPKNPLAGSADEVRTTVQAIAARDQQTARDLVRQHIENTLNAAGKDTMQGANPMAGAKVRASLTGNAQAGENLRAAIDALPGGRDVRDGFDRLMTILEATGRRQAIGSQTEFNRLLTQRLEKGGVIGETASTAASPGSWITMGRDLYQKFRYGQNTGWLARVLTDPDSAGMLRELSRHGPGSRRAWEIAGRIVVGSQIPDTPLRLTSPANRQ